MITFSAEVVEVKVKKLVSQDKGVRVILETDQVQAIELQRYIGESSVRVEVEGE